MDRDIGRNKAFETTSGLHQGKMDFISVARNGSKKAQKRLFDTPDIKFIYREQYFFLFHCIHDMSGNIICQDSLN